MSSIKLSPNASGTGEFTIAAPNSNTNRTLTLPDQTGTVLTNAGPYTANASASAGAVTIDASNNVGIGTGSPSARLHVYGTSAETLRFQSTSSAPYQTFYNSSANRAGYIEWNTSALKIDAESGASSTIAFLTANNERARIDSSGNLLVGKTTNDDTVVGVKFSAANNGNGFTAGSGFSWGVMVNRQADNGDAIRFRRTNADVGSISVTTTNTAYNTSSDYRLKHDIVPMAGALAKVAALKPVAYKWNVDGSAGEGFIAHELAEVCPGAVSGEKDAVDAEGKPIYQGIDTSFLVATLTAALQELNAKVEAQAAEIAALKGAQ